ncbi:MAG: bacillithiol biosynthesis cysteine-adding enzyme BshC [Crocinitomicaceae bacterium]
MNRQFIHRSDLHFFSKISNELTYNQESLKSFIGTPFSKSAFASQIELKKNTYSNETRLILQSALIKQYGAFNNEITTKQLQSISSSSTFFVTTGHQLNLLTGPLYFIYKIAHVIKLAQTLKQEFPENHFVPIYWMATEDHDFEEINHFHLFGKSISWETNQKGAVGSFQLENWKAWQDELKGLLNENDHKTLDELFSVYNGETLAEATRKLVHYLFGEYGLLIVDGDDKALKSVFSQIVKKEILEQFVEKEVLATNKELEKKGYSPQVYVRPLNLFYLEKGARLRLIPTEDNTQITIEGKGTFSKEKILEMLENSPESFSPNALMRPVYQELILPNLVYIGGGGELAYWLQLKSVFGKVGITYPLLSIRNSFELIDKGTQSKMEKLNLQFSDFLIDLETLKKKYILDKNEESLNFSDVDLIVENLENILVQKASITDASLVGSVSSEIARIKKSLDGIRGKLIKAEKSKFDVDLKRMEQVMHKLFPEGKFQERYDNFLPYYLKDGKNWIKNIIECSEPFNGDFQLLED